MKRTFAATLLALAAVILLSACGSSSTSSSSAAAATSGSASGSARRTALAACLKQHGVTLPTRPVGAGGPQSSGAAPPYGAGGPGAGAPPTGSGGPPPGTGGGRGFFFGGGGLSAKSRAALKACGASFPTGRRGAGFTKATLTAFVACVRRHGYKLPTPNTSGTGPVFGSGIRTNPKFVTASRACASLLRPPGGSAPTTAG